jgi:hypothetical protein
MHFRVAHDMSKTWPKGRVQRRARLFLQQLTTTRKAPRDFHMQERRQMPNDITTTPLRYGDLVLDADQWGEQNYLRGEQLVHPFGVSSERAIMMVVTRNPDLFKPGDVTKLPVVTAGGVQQVTVLTWSAVLKISGLLTTKKARKFHAWFLDVIMGERRGGRRPDGSMLRGAANPFEVMSQAMFAAGLSHWQRAAEIEAEGKRRAQAERLRAERIWSNMNVTRKQAKALIEAAAVFAPAPSQGQLPLLEG